MQQTADVLQEAKIEKESLRSQESYYCCSLTFKIKETYQYRKDIYALRLSLLDSKLAISLGLHHSNMVYLGILHRGGPILSWGRAVHRKSLGPFHSHITPARESEDEG